VWGVGGNVAGGSAKGRGVKKAQEPQSESEDSDADNAKPLTPEEVKKRQALWLILQGAALPGTIDQDDGSSRDGPVRLDVGKEGVVVGPVTTNQDAAPIAAGNDTGGILPGNGKQGQAAAAGKEAMEQNDTVGGDVSPPPPTTLKVFGEGEGEREGEKSSVGKEIAVDKGDGAVKSQTQFIRKMRKLQRIALDLAKKDNKLPFASAQGQHGSSAISFELILSLLTDGDFPPGQRFTWVLERSSEIERYHANSIILPFLQVCAKHAIISINIFSAEWCIRSGPDIHPLTVNNVKVQEDEVPLHDGDIIVIGNVELKFACGVQ